VNGSDSTGDAQPGPSLPGRFDALRWTRDTLPRSAGSIVDRLALIALGSIHATDEGRVTGQQVTSLTGLTAELVDDVLAEAADHGVIRRARGGFLPVQEPTPVDADALERLEIGRCIDCPTCGAAAFTDCRTAAGRLTGGQHQPRRSYAANWINREGQAAS
jgi:hypothetical protein